MENMTYMTYLSSDNYLIGVLALNFQLKKLKSRYPLTILLTKNLSTETMNKVKKSNIKYIFTEDLKISQSIIDNNIKAGNPNWNKTFGKLKIFGLTKFNKIVFLDSDMLILQNLDSLFQKENMSSVIAGTRYPGNENWSKTLNSGLIVVVPKVGEDKRLINLIGKGDLKDRGGDQGVIHLAYPNWPKQKSLHLDESYNLLAPYESYYLNKGLIKHRDIKVLHFIGKNKPWNMSYIKKQKHNLGLIFRSLKVNHSFKGLGYTLKDFDYYYNICHKIKDIK